MSELTPEERAQRKLSLLRQAARVSPILRDALDAVADHIAKVEAERDALREGMELAWGVIANVSEGRWDEQTAEWVAAAERWRDEHWHAIPLDPEDGGEPSVWLSAQPMSPTMRQAVEEAKQRPPARHFEPSTLLEDGERTTCATCDDSGMVTISGRPEDGPDPCPDCWPEDGERS